MAIEFHYEKRINNSAVFRNIDARQRRQWFLLTWLASMFVLSLLFYGWHFYRGIVIGYEHDQALQKQQELIDGNRRLRARLDTWLSLDRVREQALRMGMVPAMPGQRVAYQPLPADLLEQPALAYKSQE